MGLSAIPIACEIRPWREQKQAPHWISLFRELRQRSHDRSTILMMKESIVCSAQSPVLTKKCHREIESITSVKYSNKVTLALRTLRQHKPNGLEYSGHTRFLTGRISRCPNGLASGLNSIGRKSNRKRFCARPDPFLPLRNEECFKAWSRARCITCHPRFCEQPWKGDPCGSSNGLRGLHRALHPR